MQPSLWPVIPPAPAPPRPTPAMPEPQGFSLARGDHLKGRDPVEFNRALHFVAGFRNALRFLQDLDLAVIGFLEPKERAEVLNLVGQIDAATDRILVKMGEGRSVPRCAR